MKQYLGAAQEIIDSNCCRQRINFQEEKAQGLVDLANTLYKDNLKASGWYYGDVN